MDIIAGNILNRGGGGGLKAAGTGFALALVSLAVLLAAGPGHRLGLWEFRTGFAILRWAAYIATAASIFSLYALLRGIRTPGRALRLALPGLVIGLIVLYVPVSWKLRASSSPPIHDITTDTDNPPLFDRVLDLRSGSPNTAAYGGPETARIQREFYPEIAPVHLERAPQEAMDLAFMAARSLGWRIVNVDDEGSVIEATDTTFWFGFKDDVVIRITPEDDGSRVDVRSVSRVGLKDLGTNAKRIRAFSKRLSRR